MDYCKFGNLESQLMKAAVDMPPDGTERWLPESVLWRIFDCLVKGCMAMQCPPRFVPGNAPPAPPPPLAPGGALLVGAAAAIAALSAAVGAPNAFPAALAVLAAASNSPPAPVTLPTSGANLPEVIAPGNGVNAGHQGMVHFDLVGGLLIHQKPFPFNPSPLGGEGVGDFHQNVKSLSVPWVRIREMNFRTCSFHLALFLLSKSLEVIKTNLETA